MEFNPLFWELLFVCPYDRGIDINTNKKVKKVIFFIFIDLIK